jgi:hypothetical protein
MLPLTPSFFQLVQLWLLYAQGIGGIPRLLELARNLPQCARKLRFETASIDARSLLKALDQFRTISHVMVHNII